MISLSDIQDAVGAILEADADVTAALGSHNARILGGPDPTATFPYLTIGEDTGVDASVQFLSARTVRLAVHIWTKEEGFASCKDIGAAVISALETEDGFAVSTDVRCVSCFPDRERYMRDPRNGIRHGVIELETEIEATA
jgi:hypothetical protein